MERLQELRITTTDTERWWGRARGGAALSVSAFVLLTYGRAESSPLLPAQQRATARAPHYLLIIIPCIFFLFLLLMLLVFCVDV